jgi:hypothetical protein
MNDQAEDATDVTEGGSDATKKLPSNKGRWLILGAVLLAAGIFGGNKLLGLATGEPYPAGGWALCDSVGFDSYYGEEQGGYCCKGECPASEPWTNYDDICAETTAAATASGTWPRCNVHPTLQSRCTRLGYDYYYGHDIGGFCCKGNCPASGPWNDYESICAIDAAQAAGNPVCHPNPERFAACEALGYDMFYGPEADGFCCKGNCPASAPWTDHEALCAMTVAGAHANGQPLCNDRPTEQGLCRTLGYDRYYGHDVGGFCCRGNCPADAPWNDHEALCAMDASRAQGQPVCGLEHPMEQAFCVSIGYNQYYGHEAGGYCCKGECPASTPWTDYDAICAFDEDAPGGNPTCPVLETLGVGEEIAVLAEAILDRASVAYGNPDLDPLLSAGAALSLGGVREALEAVGFNSYSLLVGLEGRASARLGDLKQIAEGAGAGELEAEYGLSGRAIERSVAGSLCIPPAAQGAPAPAATNYFYTAEETWAPGHLPALSLSGGAYGAVAVWTDEPGALSGAYQSIRMSIYYREFMFKLVVFFSRAPTLDDVIDNTLPFKGVALGLGLGQDLTITPITLLKNMVPDSEGKKPKPQKQGRKLKMPPSLEVASGTMTQTGSAPAIYLPCLPAELINERKRALLGCGMSVRDFADETLTAKLSSNPEEALAATDAADWFHATMGMTVSDAKQDLDAMSKDFKLSCADPMASGFVKLKAGAEALGISVVRRIEGDLSILEAAVTDLLTTGINSAVGLRNTPEIQAAEEEAEEAAEATSTVVACVNQFYAGNALKCGWSEDRVNAIRCGVEEVTDATKCGMGWVTDATACGTQTIANGAQCGWDWVTNAVTCGFNWLKIETLADLEALASNVECTGNLFEGTLQCKFAASCNAPKTCTVPKSCQEVRTCDAPKACPEALSCTICE